MKVVTLDAENSAVLHDVALKVRGAKKVVFVAGAGISCNAGIPDFRSADGLYALVKERFPDTFVKGRDLFDSILFRDPAMIEVFYSFISGLRDATAAAQPTATHQFLKFLKDRRKLMRVYTQNIDGLEYKAGLGRSDAVQLHGSLERLTCTQCRAPCAWTEAESAVMRSGRAPDCGECASLRLARQLSGKRASTATEGQLRPDIVLYGEEHPEGDAIAQTLRKDCQRPPSVLLVAGTSLRVHGLKRLVKSLATATHSAGGITVLINMADVAVSEWGGVFDVHVKADVDAWVADLRLRVPQFFARQTRLKVERKRRAVPTVPKTDAAKRTKSEEASGMPSVDVFDAKSDAAVTGTVKDEVIVIDETVVSEREPAVERTMPKKEAMVKKEEIGFRERSEVSIIDAETLVTVEESTKLTGDLLRTPESIRSQNDRTPEDVHQLLLGSETFHSSLLTQEDPPAPGSPMTRKTRSPDRSPQIKPVRHEFVFSQFDDVIEPLVLS